MTVRYDPRDAATVADPFPVWARLREEAPVYWLEREQVWVVSRSADVERIMLDWQNFSSAKGNIVHEDPARIGRTLTTNDPPRHDKLRRLIGRGYTPKRVLEHDDRIRQLLERLIERLPGPDFDFITDLAGPLAGGVVGSLIGIPEDELDRLQMLIDEAVQVDDDDPNDAGLHAVFEFVLGIVRDRRANPRDDMISDFCAADDEGVGMSDLDIAVTCGSILGAGFTSTAHQMGNILHALFMFPDQRRLVQNDLSCVPAMIEEGLRYDVSTFCFARQTTTEVEVAGVVIPADQRLMVLLSSANRDPARFSNPDQFDFERPFPIRHMAFNIGVHHCMGSSLARLEMKIAFERLLPLLGDFELDLANAERVRSLNFRGFRRQPIHIQSKKAPA